MYKPKKSRQARAARRTVGYVRVSTEDQSVNGVSLAAQEERIRASGVASARRVDEILIDQGVSAKSLDRPAMQKILAGIRAGAIGTVVVTKLDRMTRSLRDLADLLALCAKHDVALVSLSESLDTSTAAGRLLVNLLGSVAEWEREAIGERTAAALAHKREKRQAYGRVPFGWRREGDALLKDAAEQKALRMAQAMHDDGATLRAIGAALESMGAKPHAGKAWYASSVKAVLSSRMASE